MLYQLDRLYSQLHWQRLFYLNFFANFSETWTSILTRWKKSERKLKKIQRNQQKKQKTGASEVIVVCGQHRQTQIATYKFF